MILILQLLSIFRRPLFGPTRCKSLNPKAIADGLNLEVQRKVIFTIAVGAVQIFKTDDGGVGKPGTLFHRLPSVPNADGGNCTRTNIDEVDFILSLRVAVQQ